MSVLTSASAAMPGRGLHLGSVHLGSVHLGSVHFGSVHFTPFGLAAALGLMISMAFAKQCALRTSIDPEATWDTGFFAIFSCFVTSRLLLVLGSPKAFMHYPLLLLGLPSLTFAGIALAALLTWIHLRRKQLAVLPTLDTFAAPAALLAAFLEAGYWADGAEAGMPTRLPWGIPVPGGRDSLRIHPVAFYGVILSLGLTLWLWRRLRRAYASKLNPPELNPPEPRPPEPRFRAQTQQRPGQIAAQGLLAGGLAVFALDMLSAPPVLLHPTLLEPGQWIALAAMLAGAVLWATAPVQDLPAPSGFGDPTSADPTSSNKTSHPTAPPLHMEVH